MRDWLNSILGQDGGRVAQLALALIAVILLFLLLAWLARRLLPGSQLQGATGGKSRKRLGVLEASDVDARRRLVLVRRDDVEHLIMIGGPNDLLIESRILRGAPAGVRPSVQQMPRPASSFEPGRVPAPTAGQTAPTPTSVQLGEPVASASGTPTVTRPSVADEPSLPVVAPPPPTAPFAVQFPTAPSAGPSTGQAPTAPPPFVPPMRGPAAVVANPPAAVAAPEARRPSMNDLLSAAAAAKAADPRAARPVMPPPPPRIAPAAPDLEEDDRELPTQIVAYRPTQAPFSPGLVAHAPEPVAERDTPASRETEVASRIELALADLTDVVPEPARPEPTQAPVPSFRRPVPATPQFQPAQAPAPASAAATLPQVPPRPIPTLRTPPVERPPFIARPSLPDRDDQQTVGAAMPTPPRAPEPRPVERPTGRVPPSTPVTTSPSNTQPVTAPRPPVTVVEPPPVAAPASSIPEQKSDELEEEMAKLLSELGGSSSR